MTARPAGWLVWVAAVVAIGATARLGVWQLDRAAQKTALHTAWSERAQLPALQAAELARARSRPCAAPPSGRRGRAATRRAGPSRRSRDRKSVV